ncbi:hypothetical protein [Streptomyces sp. SCL15-6]|uniref:hypothetical protein n=1 Tax=Streptomyces sp. SCL15-6 TaxID=2967222 RepID=UPI0029670D91|nr:hypothetical protein [Streptomyces sp. SCL15-6]
MFLQLFEGATAEALVPIATVGVVLAAAARIVRNLPTDSINKYIEHRTSKYQIIARDTGGRVARAQKRRLLFLGFVVACIAAVSLFFISSTSSSAPPASRPAPISTAGSASAQ